MTTIVVLIILAVIGFKFYPLLMSLIGGVYRIVGNAAKGVATIIGVGFLVFMVSSHGIAGLFWGLILMPIILILGTIILGVFTGTIIKSYRERKIDDQYDDFTSN